MLSGATGTCDWGRTHIAVERKHTEWRDHHTNLMWQAKGDPYLSLVPHEGNSFLKGASRTRPHDTPPTKSQPRTGYTTPSSSNIFRPLCAAVRIIGKTLSTQAAAWTVPPTGYPSATTCRPELTSSSGASVTREIQDVYDFESFPSFALEREERPPGIAKVGAPCFNDGHDDRDLDGECIGAVSCGCCRRPVQGPVPLVWCADTVEPWDGSFHYDFGWVDGPRVRSRVVRDVCVGRCSCVFGLGWGCVPCVCVERWVEWLLRECGSVLFVRVECRPGRS